MTESKMREIRANATASFKGQLKEWGFKKGKIDDMSAGFSDGYTTALRDLIESGELTHENNVPVGSTNSNS